MLLGFAGVGPVASQAGNCLERNAWICGRFFTTRADTILADLGQHVTLTAVSVGIGLAIALPLAVLAHNWRASSGPVLGVSSVVYTIPSLALFALLVPFTGLTATTVVVGLVLYSLVVLVRNILAGLRGVPEEISDAARGMGYGRWRLLTAVQLPLALPAIVAGLRIATVSTVALVTVGAVINQGGLGNLLYDAIQSDFKAEVFAASVLCVGLAVVADLVLLGVQRVADRRTGRTSGRSGGRTSGRSGGRRGAAR